MRITNPGDMPAATITMKTSHQATKLFFAILCAFVALCALIFR